MSKGYFHVFHDPEDGFISGKAKDVARDMVVRGAFKPYGWLEILIWTGISMFLSVKLCDHFQVESGIVRIIIWPFLGIFILSGIQRHIFPVCLDHIKEKCRKSAVSPVIPPVSLVWRRQYVYGIR